MDFDSLVDDNEKQTIPAKPLQFDALKEDKPDQSNLKFDDLKDDSEKTVADTLNNTPGFIQKKPGEPGYVQLNENASPQQQKLVNSSPSPEMAKQLVGSAAGAGVMNFPGLPLASFGARGLKGALEAGAIQAGDEIDKAALGQGDPTPAVAAKLAGAGALGFLVGGITGQRPQTASAALRAVEDSRLGSHISDMLKGIGKHFEFSTPEGSKLIPEDVKSKAMYKIGQGIAKAIQGKGLSTVAGAATGHFESGFIADAVKSAIQHMFGDKLTSASQKKLAPWIMRMASSEIVKNPSQIVEHAKDITRGDTAMSKGVEALFIKGGRKAYDEALSDKEKDKLKESVENGDLLKTEDSPQGFAKGGDVQSEQNNEIANHWPEQNIMLSSAKARVHNYLNSIRPMQNQSALPFDSEHKDHHKEREYNKALNLAGKPLSILNHVKDGSLVPSQVSAFNAMYPEIHQELSKRMTKKMIENKLDKSKRPPYKVRQAMSLFMGTTLDSTMSPIAIQTAQAVFSQQKAQNPTVNNSSLSKIGQSYRTDDQSRERDLNK